MALIEQYTPSISYSRNKAATTCFSSWQNCVKLSASIPWISYMSIYSVCMYVQLVPIRERYKFTGYIFCIPIWFTIHNLVSSDLQFPTAHTKVLKWLQKLCAPTALLLRCLSPGESRMAAGADYGQWRSSLQCVSFH